MAQFCLPVTVAITWLTMGLLLEANMMSAHAESCACSGRPVVHPRHKARVLGQPCTSCRRAICERSLERVDSVHQLTTAHTIWCRLRHNQCWLPGLQCHSSNTLLFASFDHRCPIAPAQHLPCYPQDAGNGRGPHGNAVAPAHRVLGRRGKHSMGLPCTSLLCYGPS